MEIRYINSFNARNQLAQLHVISWEHAYWGIVPQVYLDKIQKGHTIVLDKIENNRELIVWDCFISLT